MNKIFKVGDKLLLPSLKIVFTNGCFDVLHPGHLQYLKKAHNLGEILVVGLNSDKSIRRIKGKDRPINNFEFRSSMLSYFQFIDFIVEFDEDTPIDLIRRVRPNVLVKGSDYQNKEVIGSDLVKESGGEVVFLDYLEGYSSTSVINRILNSKL
jgi:rfaE bifunctional protein nucleotidyltransferase chain/domain